jgi:hypothetical protein
VAASQPITDAKRVAASQPITDAKRVAAKRRRVHVAAPLEAAKGVAAPLEVEPPFPDHGIDGLRPLLRCVTAPSTGVRVVTKATNPIPCEQSLAPVALVRQRAMVDPPTTKATKAAIGTAAALVALVGVEVPIVAVNSSMDPICLASLTGNDDDGYSFMAGVDPMVGTNLRACLARYLVVISGGGIGDIHNICIRFPPGSITKRFELLLGITTGPIQDGYVDFDESLLAKAVSPLKPTPELASAICESIGDVIRTCNFKRPEWRVGPEWCDGNALVYYD